MSQIKRLFPNLILVLFLLLLSSACVNSTSKNRPEADLKAKETTNVVKSTELQFDAAGVTSDPFNDPRGPFYHNVYKAASKDGLNFKKTNGIVLEKASVPDLVKMNDGRLIMYAVDGARRSFSGFMVAISKDNGKTFQQGSVQFSSKVMALADPQVILTNDGNIRLFYVQFPEKKPPLDASGKPISTGDKIKIKSAISSDGINFEVEDGSRYETTEIVTDPDVIKIGSKWFMYLAKGPELIATSSSDGNNFKLEKSVRQQGSVSKTVAIGAGKYRQFYCKDGISSAITTDGLNFSAEDVSLSAENGQIICDPTPVKVGNQWLMFYKVQPADNLPPKS